MEDIYSKLEIHGVNFNGMGNMGRNQASGLLSSKSWLDFKKKMMGSSMYRKIS